MGGNNETTEDRISELEARTLSVAIARAMYVGDKPGREALYADLTPESLKRIIRWQTRSMLTYMSMIASMQGIDDLTQTFNDILLALAKEEEK